MKFDEQYTQPKGHLEIYKVFPDGNYTLFYSDSNVVCSGMGVTLAEAFAADLDSPVTEFQISLFQIGTAGLPGLQVSSNGRLGNSLSLAEYGTGSLELVTQSMIASGTVYASEVFGVIPSSFVDKVGATKVRWRILVDRNVGNGLVLNEIGLFSKNPSQLTPTATSYLCAYRNFSDLTKTSEFSLDVRWTIEF